MQRTVWYQGTATLLRNADKAFLHRLLVDIGKVDVVKLHPTDLLQLLFYPSPCLKGVFQAASHGFLVVLFVRIQKFKWLFRVFSGCPADPCAVMQFLWDRYRPLRSLA